MRGFFKKIVVTVLTAEARFLLKRRRPIVVAITGSVGKTSTKDAIYAAIKDHLHTRKSQKSYNSEIGVPLSVLGLENGWGSPVRWVFNLFDGALTALLARDYPRVLVLEMGVDRPGDMENLMKWITPDIAVLTSLPEVPVHVEYFSSPEAVAEEKLKLVNALAPDGILIYNNDDERVRKAVAGVRQKSFSYARYSEADFRVGGEEVLFSSRRPSGMKATVVHGSESAELRVRGSLGIQNLYSYAAAVAVAHALDIAVSDSAKALEDVMPPSGRMRIIEGIKDSLILDDTYNSSPTAAASSLTTLGELNSFGRRKVAILGDMMELGKYSTDEHRRIGLHAVTAVDLLITIGLRARKIAAGALEGGLEESKVFQYDNVEEAIKSVPDLIEDGDAILVKGSQGIRAEKLVAVLMEHPELAGKLLVRQDEEWQKR